MSSALQRRVPSTEHQIRQDRWSWWAGYVAWMFFTLVMAGLAFRNAPRPFALALLVLALGSLVMITKPVAGVCLLVGLTPVGDIVTVAWYPFTKNMSSRESILFVSDSIPLSPVELYLVVLLFGWLAYMLGTQRWSLYRGGSYRTIMLFTLFTVYGMANGLARGGDRQIALYESRAIFYLPMLYVVVTNTFKTTRHFVWMYASAVAGITVHALLSRLHLRHLSPAELQNSEAVMQHASALVMNIVLVIAIASLLFRDSSRAWRYITPLLCLPILQVYFVSRRRAAIIGLAGAVIVIAMVLFWKRRRSFYRVVPVFAMVATVYVGAFWGASSSAIGFPAQAVKSVVAPSKLSERDQNSNLYRIIETENIKFTIRSTPIRGIGFGQAFYRPIPLPNITTFLLAEYVPHNSMLWVWMKMGVGGFMVMVYMFGKSMRTGARALAGHLEGDARIVTIASVSFVLMYAIFMYVDIAWDAKSMVLLAAAMAQIDLADRDPAPPTEVPTAATSDVDADRSAQLVPA